MAIIEALLDVSVNNQVTEAVNIGTYGLIGLIVPPLVTCNGKMMLTFEVSPNGGVGTFRALYDENGNRFDIDVGLAGGRAISTDDLAPLAGYKYVKIIIDCAQAADATFVFVLKG